MSVDVTTVPPWKQELMERKRRQEEEEKRRQQEEEARLAMMPSWKREILLKKNQQKSNVIFISDSPPSGTGQPASPRQEVDKDIQSEVSPSQRQKTGRSSSHGNLSSAVPTQHVQAADQTQSTACSPPAQGSLPGMAAVVERVATHNLSVGSMGTHSNHSNSTSDAEFAAALSTNHKYFDGDTSNLSLSSSYGLEPGVGEEHLLPVQQNPWFKTDRQKRKKSGKRSKSSSAASELTTSTTDSYLSHHTSDGADVQDYDGILGSNEELDTYPENDSVFPENGEVTYGRGFVHKLLRKFKHMSAKDEVSGDSNIACRRTVSSDNILEDAISNKLSPEPGNYSPRHGKSTNFSSRTRSMENLSIPLSLKSPNVDKNDLKENNNRQDCLSKTVDSDGYFDHTDTINDIPQLDSGANNSPHHKSAPDVSADSPQPDLPRRNIVSSYRNKFESKSPRSPSARISWHGEPTKSAHLYTDNDKVHLTENNSTKTNTSDKQLPSGGLGHSDKINLANNIPNGVESDHSENSEQENGFKTTKASKDVVKSLHAAGKSWTFPRGGATEQSEDKTKSVAATKKKSQKPHSAPTTPAQNESYSIKHTAQPQPNKSFLYGSLFTPRTTNAGNATKFADSSPGKSNKSDADVSDNISQSAKLSSGLVNGWDSSAENAEVNNSAAHSAQPSQDQVKLKQENKRPDTRKLNLNLDFIDTNANLSQGSSQSKAVSDKNDFIAKNDRRRHVKRPAPTGPGSMLIRPASNMVTGSTNTEYLNLTKYHDVKVGDFAPARKRPAYNGDDVPITNIDDMIGDDIPVTDIDGVFHGHDTNENVLKKPYEFVGAGVSLGRNMLEHTREHNEVRNQAFINVFKDCFQFNVRMHIKKFLVHLPVTFTIDNVFLLTNFALFSSNMSCEHGELIQQIPTSQ